MEGRFAAAPEALQQRCNSFVSLQAWPLRERLDWQGWLGNFKGDELFFARCLLESFLYYRDHHADALMLSAFRSISRDVCLAASDTSSRNRLWQEFLRRVILTYVEGERPSPTDSGLTFARRGRTVLGIPQSRIVTPDRALELAQADPATPVVFVDDFLGSGRQFVSTWQAERVGAMSFAKLAAAASFKSWYVPLLATEYGIGLVKPLIVGAVVLPAHILGDRYSALSDSSIIWPKGRQRDGREFVEAVSLRAGYGSTECWGFHSLALTVGILDTVPDASLPLFYSQKNSWRPLMARR